MKKYLDKHGKPIKEGMTLRHDDGDTEYVYKSNDGDLGFNASNEAFAGFDPLHRELYPLHQFDLKEWHIVNEG